MLLPQQSFVLLIILRTKLGVDVLPKENALLETISMAHLFIDLKTKETSLNGLSGKIWNLFN